MEKINLHAVYEFAATIKPVSAWWADTTLDDLWVPLHNARLALNELLDNSQPLRLRTSRNAAIRLKGELDQLWRIYFVGEDGKDHIPEKLDTVVQSWMRSGARQAAQAFEAVFRAEMENSPVYAIAKKRNYDVADLADSFDSGLPDDLRGVIGEKALDEYRAAGRCYAFGLSAAAGFHACRAVELVLHNYCGAFVTKTDKLYTWGNYIECLRGVAGDQKPIEKTIEYLDLLREHHRNLLMHARAEFSDTDADVLLGLAKAAIVFMAQELATIEGAGRQLRLAAVNDSALDVTGLVAIDGGSEG